MINLLKEKYTAHKNRGFTLIELIVVMAVVAVLVLLAVPKFLGQTNEATRTKHIANISEIESASERYHVDEGDWPRLTDDPYTSEQIADYSDRIFDLTGEPVELDPDGKYYNIDYDKLDKYVRVDNADKNRYILQNPVGRVFYLENLSTEGKMRVDYGVVPEESDNEEGIVLEGPIPIADADELNNVRNATIERYGKGTQWEGLYEGGLDKEYIQVADIDLSEYSKEEKGWNPIGTDTGKFIGIYDGDGYKIIGLTINSPTTYIGLFGRTEGATIANVSLEDINVTRTETGYYTGGLVGIADKSIIENSYATGSVTGGGYIGGLVGSATYNTKISNSYFTGSVTGRENVGGLVGHTYSETTIENSYTTGSVTGGGTYNGNTGGLVGFAQSGTKISNSYSKGDVTGTEGSVGGLVGIAYNTDIENAYATGSVTGERSKVGGLVGEASSSSTIENSYATGEVTGRDYVGGLIGFLSSSTIINSYSIGSATGLVTESYEISGWNVGGLVGQAVLGTISSSYATGSVTGTNQVGGLVGWELTNNNTTMTSNSYWDTETTGRPTSASGKGKSTAEMKKQAIYENWNFDTVWEIDEGNDYPKLR